MTKKTTTDIGNEGEELACAYLESKGWRILERNYFFEKSEVDIVAYDDTAIVFIEVKMRSSDKFGKPEEFVSEVKVEHVFKAAEAWMYERKMEGSPMRFDVIGILNEKGKAPAFNHIEDAFR
ncbi:YraN family protein [Balneola vulgaris]|jgi:putative endonuclease|uniref:YraN family protein n=1 Tax=Balneola vulgaris TaxID=287535 RepID=UPI00036CFAB9|nr:YraN family protein [Balneola vulgaris]